LYFCFYVFIYEKRDESAFAALLEKGPLKHHPGHKHSSDHNHNFHHVKRSNALYGGFFTQEDIVDIIKFAKKNFVTVIPEIEVPGFIFFLNLYIYV
jgi:hexosaminidase